MADQLALHRDGAVAYCQLNAPDRLNALNSGLIDRLHDSFRQLMADGRTRVLVLGGSGRAFCAGADIHEFAGLLDKPEQLQQFNSRLNGMIDALAALPIATIAAVNGLCFGGGVSLALACDLRLGLQDARFALTPGRLGLMYGPSDSRRLVRAVGHAKAADFLLTGRQFDADEALQAGLIQHRAADLQALQTLTDQWAKTLAEQSLAGLSATKALLDFLSGGPGDEADFQRCYDELFAGPDAAEGAAAFREKRPPKFRWHPSGGDTK